MLKGLAGLGLAACARPVPKRAIAGSIIGASDARGHRVRDGFRPTPGRREEIPVVIVGAGIAGLSAAWALERAGLRDFVVLELEDVPGGTARSGSGPVSAYPWGAHYVPVPDPANRALVALLEEVGAVAGRDAGGRPVYAEQVLCRDPQERLFFRGEWYEGLFPRAGAAAAELAQLESLESEMRRWAAWRDSRGRRGFAIPRARGSDAELIRELDRVSMADWLAQRGWTSPRLRWFVEYGCRDDFGTTLHLTSAWAGIHYFAARLESAASQAAEFLTWPEGNGRLVSHLAGIVGRRLRLGAVACDVVPRPDHVEVVYFDAGSGEGAALAAEHVVFALPRFLAKHLVAPYRDAPPAHLDATVYGAWLVANLTLRDRPASRGFPLAWDNVIYDSPSLGYVVATHQSGRDHGATVLTYYLPLLDADPSVARRRLLALTWDEAVAQILADLQPSHPGLADLVERVDIVKWGHAMPRPRPGFLWSDELVASARALGRLHFAHTDLSGMGLFEEAQYWGIRAAEDVLEQRRVAFRSWLA
ncbi:MAG TPA: FAD-dependent oxidoreductase [Thermoleophilia bacterium]|nr:FAD-dependent oxidoreductase [Thermoleophilia bacterium]